MKNIIRILFCSAILVWTSNLKAEVSYGIALQAGQVSTDGTETEGTAADTSTRTKSIDERFVGADLFIENTLANGYTVGLSYVPLDIELGSGSRTDTAAVAENDAGTRKASADVEDLITLYTNIPISGDYYALFGIHHATVSTSETLPNSKYGDEDIFGGLIGFGMKSGNIKYEVAYSDFEDISISSSGGDNNNSVSADADAITFRLSYGF